MPGSGLSTRSLSSKNKIITRTEAEDLYIIMLATIREQILENQVFDLLGHSYGGYLASIYFLNTREQQHIRKLILLSPWGIKRDRFSNVTEEE